MKDIAIYTLTSSLHDEDAVGGVTREFLGSLGIEYSFKGSDFSEYGRHDLDLIFVRTGGSEGIILPMIPELRARSKAPFYLLTSGKSNSLAASLEILSYLRQNGMKGEILHGSPEYISGRISLLERVGAARRKLDGRKLGVVGKPSDWLIASQADYPAVKAASGIELVDIPLQRVNEICSTLPEQKDEELLSKAPTQGIKDSISDALKIYEALKVIISDNELSGLTIRCFDLLTSMRNTGCVALAKLNSEGLVGCCEGDVPTMLSMAVSRAVTGVSGFQANPSRIDPQTGELLFAHCTIPFEMVESYELDTHFESGIGVGVRGWMKNGDVTIFKVSGDLKRHFAAEGRLVRSQAEANLCRTQQVIMLDDPSQAKYFLTDPIGNHHVIIPGHCRAELDALMESLQG